MSCLLCEGELEVFYGNLKGNISAYPGNVYPFNIMKCKNCDLLQKDITKSYLDFLQDIYCNHYDFFSNEQNSLNDGEVKRGKVVIEAICNLVSKKKVTWLDYGCGGGNFLRLLSQEKPQWELYGYDVSLINSDKFDDLKLKKQIFTNIEDIKVKFDVISLNMVLEHLHNPQNILEKLRDKINNDGYLVVRIPDFKNLPTDFFIYEHMAHYHKNAIETLMVKSGFIIEQYLDKIPNIELAFIAKKAKKNKKNIVNLVGGGGFINGKK
ncbi:hypothetical protein B6S12_03085 [Helicobacter valdiviensis]|uniref:Methyltransferase n=1 Tax=Helicobacter valdiviensis TaxID=1458358 RepID=A0A2W6MVT9_9HELI|nr:class I SAM-dependent methyltransferase [Helicobacter valdiviensis]PZT48634.1 hypothetical protein B6S12_03085 [Helicobacter valdiviensis]